MRHTLLALVFLAATAHAAGAQTIAGDWEGTLKTPAADLHVALHVTAKDGGGLTATFDSVDQQTFGIPVTSIAQTGAKVTFVIDPIRGWYEGTLNAGATGIDGAWSQGVKIALAFTRVAPKAAPAAAAPTDIDGTWAGTLTIGSTTLRVVLHLKNNAAGLTATMDSPDQGVSGIPVAAVTRSGYSLKLDVKANGGVFDGTIDARLIEIEGTWSQGGRTWPLKLTPVKDPAALEVRRPQNPVKPYPYREEEITYPNASADITLAATLTLPAGNGPFPAVVLITGSGPQDRDEALAGHRPFLVLADYLTRRGIAVLRTDDRGFGKSGGTFATATTADFATDTEAGVAYLQTRHEIDQTKIGLIGHSEGGIIAPMVAARNPHVAFIVMMAGSGVDGGALLVEQNRLIAEAFGATREQADVRAAQIRTLVDIEVSEKDPAARFAKMHAALDGKLPAAEVEAQIRSINTPWFRYFLAYDPATALRSVKCPVLALNGEKDLQVPPRQNLPAIRAALAAGGNTNVTVEELPGLNHLFQTAKTGSPAEYPQIEETIAPVALDTIARWILKQ